MHSGKQPKCTFCLCISLLVVVVRLLLCAIHQFSAATFLLLFTPEVMFAIPFVVGVIVVFASVVDFFVPSFFTTFSTASFNKNNNRCFQLICCTLDTATKKFNEKSIKNVFIYE